MEQGKNLEDFYIIKDGRKLQYGYTTGSCAAAAAKAAALILLGKKPVEQVRLMTPRGICLHLDIKDIKIEPDRVSCAVQKDAGDDPDVTDGIFIYAAAEKDRSGRITIDGGPGVGRITKKGLEQPVGAAAINKIPRQMIYREAEQACNDCDYEGGLRITIWTPQGESLAKRTFNPRLGIEGGISILGTSGIVVPMSEEALLRSIEIEMRMHVENGEKYLLITPGNYGEAYLKEHTDLDFSKNIKCSNFVGKAIDMALNMEVQGILFVSHIGKFIKVAAGIMNTHSREADARAEVMAAGAIRAGADAKTAAKILSAVTTDEALGILHTAKTGLADRTMEQILERIQYYLDARAYHRIELGAILFSNEYGYLGKTKGAAGLEEKLK